ncbi:DHH family phosphoesterase [Parasalinivibrio latis]|uniref:DHH family phosphoesterase n=1 Tax=Parasalinivibrio latis TaxID=2952610 RepID=UPI0030E5086B
MIKHYDIFNGDADGILALLQLRKAFPVENALLVTGIKRNIGLLQFVPVSDNQSLTVLDISMEKNISALLEHLDAGSRVFYADHHRSGEIPEHPNLDAHIHLEADICTSLIVDRLLDGRFQYWAIAAAYGDNLKAVAKSLCGKAGLSHSDSVLLEELGTLVNYNGYGSSEEDLHYHPADLYKLLLKYDTPFDVIADASSPFHTLRAAYTEDMARAASVSASYVSDFFELYTLPDEAWSRRVSGVFGNSLSTADPNKAHAVLTANSDGSYLVSLRAPLNNKQGAGMICSRFDTGGGREAAAGINRLEHRQLEAFINAVETHYSP